jgi:CHAD domain-containing protein
MMATLDLVRAVNPDLPALRLRRRLKKHLKILSPLRDLQVQRIALRSAAADVTGLSPIVAELGRRQRHLLSTVRSDIAAWKVDVLDRGVAEVIREVHLSSKVSPGWSEALIGSSAVAFLRVRTLRMRVDPGDLVTIHRLRVAFKRFRYSIEVVRPLLPWVSHDLLRSLGSYQDLLGAVQDSVVLSSSVSARLKSLHVGPESAQRIRTFLEKRIAHAVEELFRSVDHIHRFWIT